MLKFSYDELQFTEELTQIIRESGIQDDQGMLLLLELYKFYSREKIIQCLTPQVQEYSLLNISEGKRDSEYALIEKQFDVIIFVVDGGALEVISSVTEYINKEAIELKLGFAPISFIKVTPVNFLQLSGQPLPEYEPLILFKRILIEAVAQHVTDIHFDVKHFDVYPTYTVSFRKNGELLPYTDFEITDTLNKRIIGVLTAQKTSANSLDLLDPAGIVTSAPNVLGTDSTELRITANKVQDGYHYVIRVQQKTTTSMSIDELGFDAEVLKSLKHTAGKRSGITLITGAIRTGKNTTAFAMANAMCKDPIKIISYESPIEVLMPFTQIDYQENTSVLLEAIRLAKKQDINVAFINELPSKEVAFAVQDLVNSSIHVITTMHVNRIWHLPYKLKEYYGDSYKDVLSQINAVYNQKMFGVCCEHCKVRILVDSLENTWHKKFLKDNGITSLVSSVGCPECNGTGIIPSSNQPYVEFLEFSDELVTKLLACDAPYEMELILRKFVQGQSLENYMLKDIQQGKLSVNTLDYIM